jgi:hypothetical protein
MDDIRMRNRCIKIEYEYEDEDEFLIMMINYESSIRKPISL